MEDKVLSKINYREMKWLTIDNSVKQDVEIAKSSGSYFISGDNSAREFSGFDKGFSLLKTFNPQDTDLVIFANDTFHRSYGSSYLEAVTIEKIESAVSSASLLGT